MEPTIITTTLKTSEDIIHEARQISANLGLFYVPREKKSLEHIKDTNQAEQVMVVGQGVITLETNQGSYFFHPSMAKVRIKDLLSGQADQMVTAMGLERGYRVLDCTLGLGTDALVSSFAVGEEGMVVGLEKVKLIALITSHGLKNYTDKNHNINSAMRRIEVINADCYQYLKELPDKSFDVVYFDPMFRKPRLKSSAMNALRRLADPSPLTLEIISEAKRVAAKRVVMKENSFSQEFARLGFEQKAGGKYSPIAYGVMEI